MSNPERAQVRSSLAEIFKGEAEAEILSLELELEIWESAQKTRTPGGHYRSKSRALLLHLRENSDGSRSRLLSKEFSPAEVAKLIADKAGDDAAADGDDNAEGANAAAKAE